MGPGTGSFAGLEKKLCLDTPGYTLSVHSEPRGAKLAFGPHHGILGRDTDAVAKRGGKGGETAGPGPHSGQLQQGCPGRLGQTALPPGLAWELGLWAVWSRACGLPRGPLDS